MKSRGWMDPEFGDFLVFFPSHPGAKKGDDDLAAAHPGGFRASREGLHCRIESGLCSAARGKTKRGRGEVPLLSWSCNRELG